MDNTSALVLFLSSLAVVVVYVWTALALAGVFGKLGIAGWKAWVPFYGHAIVLGLGGMSGWLLLLLLIPFLGPVFVYAATVAAAHRIGGTFGVGAGMTVLAALLFPVWASVLGFGSARAVQAFPVRAPDRHEDADAALRPLSPEFGRGVSLDTSTADVFASRRDVPAPSAWIPPAALSEPSWVASVPVDAGPVVPEPSAPAGYARAPRDEPAREGVPPAAAPPAPVTSWWQPAAEAGLAAPSHVEPSRIEPAPHGESASPAVLRGSYLPEPEAFPEESGEVSAVVGSPVAGPPRAASASVAAARPGVGEVVDDTVIVSRRRPQWSLRLPDGTSVDLTGESVVIGRRPVPVHTAPGAQLVVVADATRTVSKTHALLRRRDDAWLVSDLGSTNGVVVFDGAAEVEVAPGADAEIVDRFLLGDAELRLARRDLV